MQVHNHRQARPLFRGRHEHCKFCPSVSGVPALEVYFFEPLEKEISVEDMQKIVDANEKLVKEMKDADR